MDIEYKFSVTAPCSLHDRRINRIKPIGDHLRLYFESGYYSLNHDAQVNGNLLIQDVSMNFSDVHFLSENGNYGNFKGIRMELACFLNRFKNFSLEIIDELHGYNTVFYRGFLALPNKQNLIDMTISIYYTGNIVYEIKD